MWIPIFDPQRYSWEMLDVSIPGSSMPPLKDSSMWPRRNSFHRRSRKATTDRIKTFTWSLLVKSKHFVTHILLYATIAEPCVKVTFGTKRLCLTPFFKGSRMNHYTRSWNRLRARISYVKTASRDINIQLKRLNLLILNNALSNRCWPQIS